MPNIHPATILAIRGLPADRDLTGCSIAESQARNALADRLQSIPQPPGTDLYIQINNHDHVVLEWSNLDHQHAVLLSVNLEEYQAHYQYSQSSNLADPELDFPARPLGSIHLERNQMDLHSDSVWTWLRRRVQATAHRGRRPPPEPN